MQLPVLAQLSFALTCLQHLWSLGREEPGHTEYIVFPSSGWPTTRQSISTLTL